MTTKRLFRFLGLSNRSYQVYELVLERGPILASALAQELDIPRTTIYLELQNLQKQGLISVTGSQKKRKFIAEQPSHLVHLLEEKVKDIHSLIPEAKHLVSILEKKTSGQPWSVPNIKFYKGTDGIRKVLESAIHARSKLVYAILPASDLASALGDEYAKQYVLRRVKAGVRVKNIWSRNAPIPRVWSDHQAQLRDIRFVEGPLPFQSGFITFDDIVIMITSIQEHFSIQIKSQDLARTMRFIFDIVWASASPEYKSV